MRRKLKDEFPTLGEFEKRCVFFCFFWGGAFLIAFFDLDACVGLGLLSGCCRVSCFFLLCVCFCGAFDV